MNTILTERFRKICEEYKIPSEAQNQLLEVISEAEDDSFKEGCYEESITNSGTYGEPQ